MHTFKTTLRTLVLTVFGLSLFGLSACDVINARQLAREGNEAYLAFDYRTAISRYLEAERLDPETPNLYLNLGYSYFSVYDPTAEKEEDKQAAVKAVAAFEKHLSRHPEDNDARVFQIKTLLKAAPHDKQMADKALTTFQQMLVDNPKDHEARQYLITLFIDCSRYQDAVAFFEKELTGTTDDLETMKILAIIADKSKQTQAAVDWYFKRSDYEKDGEKKAILLYEVGTYAWNLLHYQPERITGVAAIKLADQGIEACREAMSLKEKYAEAMIYGNLLYLKRSMFEPDEQSRAFSQAEAFELRKAAGLILMERKKAKAAQAGAGDKKENDEKKADGAADKADQKPDEANKEEAADKAGKRADEQKKSTDTQ